MRNKVAKRLRKQAQGLPTMYDEVRKGGVSTANFLGYDPVTYVINEKCARAKYKNLKRNYNV